MASNTKRGLVIGIDYGTTHTGVAYCERNGSLRDIQLILDWPGNHGHIAFNEKVPSQVAYSANKFEWGNSIHPTAERQCWTKLKLDDTIVQEPNLEALLGEKKNGVITTVTAIDSDDEDNDDIAPSYPGKKPVDIVTDFLSGVKDHVFNHLRKEFGAKPFNAMHLDIVLTVPAVWTDKAKNLAFQAVERADFADNRGRIHMMAEPEAAANYTLKALESHAATQYIRADDHFILCDAGGGAVELLTYRVSSTSPDFRVKEATVGAGDKCGATFINRSFRDWLEKRVGEKTLAKVPPSKLREGSKLLREFEAAKMAYDGSNTETFLTLPSEAGVVNKPSSNIEDGEILLTGDDLKEMFEPSVKKTIEMIDEQVSTLLETGSRVKYVFLVGGFGRSEYLFNRIEEYCNSHGIDLRRPAFPWSAVARGAVARGLELPLPGSNTRDLGGLVQMRRCRYHYGTPVSQTFNPSKHIMKDMYQDPMSGARYAKGQMHWLFTKGDELDSSKPKRATIDCCRTFGVNEPRIFGAQLAFCREDEQPKRYMDEDVFPLCKVQADLSSIPEHKFMRAQRSGRDFLIAQFQIAVEVDNSKLKFKLLFKGEECGKIETTFES